MTDRSAAGSRGGGATLGLALGALGVVYGDIGTSPLYAVKAAFHGRWAISASDANVLGVLSLVFWLLTLVIGVKYLLLLFRAHHQGEGGIVALLTLLLARRRSPARWRASAVGLGLVGAGLLYGDGMITPAISVLSAVEGLRFAAPALEALVLPATIGILLVLFAVQRLGTGRIGTSFGPLILLWLLTLGALGLRGIASQPAILAALDPSWAWRLFRDNGPAAFGVLSAVVLVVTGGEALYADLGHFGPRPIRLAWFAVAYPCLLLNYLGQGALLLARPEAAANPFYLLAPAWSLWPLTVLATVATVIASQALISASFSLTAQLGNLDFLPRPLVLHTSASRAGQIYVPLVNTVLCLASVALVLAFRDSGRLAAAYGLAVVGTMMVSSVLFYLVSRHCWDWGRARAGAVAAAMLTVELALLGPNALKLAEGAWVPLLVAAALFALMSTWRRGRELIAASRRDRTLAEEIFLRDVDERRPVRVPGTAVFMTPDAEGIPPVLLHHFKHNKVLHDRVVLLTVRSPEVPHLRDDERIEVVDLGAGLYRASVRHGFMEPPDVPAALASLDLPELPLDPAATSYYLGRETIEPTGASGLARWRAHLFATLARNASRPGWFFHLPPNRVVELGAQVEL